ncbi:MAG TPA: rhodanese-like domain-containing protein [Nitrospirota bacterium]|nr:rhodanese-like domain-containing protein [Nitrospirota bacterium]
MNKRGAAAYAFVMVLILVTPSAYGENVASDSMANKLNEVLLQAQSQKDWQTSADDVFTMIKEKKTDFLIVDVRPNPQEYKTAHIVGSISIPHFEILKPENLAKLPKGKKIILVCATGQTCNLPIVALRALGYDVYSMRFGYTAWIKDYRGAKLMQDAIQGAATKNYPVEK